MTQEPADASVDDDALFIICSHPNAFKTAAGLEITP